MKKLTMFGVVIGILTIGCLMLYFSSFGSAERQPNDCNNIIYLHGDVDDNTWMNAERNDPSSDADYIEQRMLGGGEAVEEFPHIPNLEETLYLETGVEISVEIHIDITEGVITDVAFSLFSGSTELGSESETAVNGDNTYQFNFMSNQDQIVENLRVNITFSFTAECEYRIYTDSTSWINLPIKQEPPEINNIKVTDITKDTAKINWDTNEDSDFLVVYWEVPEDKFTEAKTDLVKTHQIKLTGLKFDTTYHFYVRSSDANGNQRESNEYSFKTAWVVKGFESRSNEIIDLSTNLIIDTDGLLIFENVTLRMDCSYDGEFFIEVRNRGEFHVLDSDENPDTKYDASIITSVDPKYNYAFNVRNGAEFEMKNSELYECGYGYFGGELGLTIETDEAIIENNIISENYDGIFCKSSSPSISNNDIFDNMQSGINIFSGNPTILNNYISDNSIGIYSNESKALIKDNEISNNDEGIFCIGVDPENSPTIIGNSIKDNELGILCYYNSPIISDNIFMDNEIGIGSEESDLLINESTFKSNDAAIVCFGYYEDTELEIKNCTFSDENGVAIAIPDGGCSAFIEYSTITDTEDFAFDIYNGFLSIKHSMIVNSDKLDFRISDGAEVTTLNTTFDKDKVEIKGDSKLTVKWFLDIITVDPEYQIEYQIIKDVEIRIQDNENGEFDENFISDAIGMVNLIEVTEYIQNETEKMFFTPYNITLEKELDFTEIHLDITKTSIEKIVLNDLTPPEISDPVYDVKDISAIINWTTNEKTDFVMNYGLDDSYGSEVSDNELVILHSIELTELSEGTTYHIQIISTDAYDNLKESQDFIFKTDPDSTPPVISNVKNSIPTDKSVIITWETNELATSQVEFGITTPYGKTTRKNTLTLSHSVELTGLISNQTYDYRVISQDFRDNEIISPIFNFKTEEAQPIPPPNIELIMEIDNTNPFEKQDVTITVKIKNNGEREIIVDVFFMEANSQIGKEYDQEIDFNETITLTDIWRAKEIGIYDLKVIIKYEDEEIASDSKEVEVKVEEIVNIDSFLETDLEEIETGDKVEITATTINNADNPITIVIIMFDNDKEINRTTETIDKFETYEMKHIWEPEKEGEHIIKVIINHDGKEISNESKIVNVNEKDEDDDYTMIIISIVGVIAICTVVGIFIWWRSGFEYEE